MVASVPTPAPITTSPAPTKKPESTTVFPSSTGQGWPPLFSSRGFGTDQALGFRREVHAAHSGRGFRPSGQGAHAGGAEPAVGTVLVSRDGINPARHLGSLGQARTLDGPLGAAGSQLSDRSSLSFHGSFEDAVSELFPLYDAAERPFLVNASRPQSLIIIKERKN